MSFFRSLKTYKLLATRKGRLESGAFLIEGDRAIRQIIQQVPDAVLELLTIKELSSEYGPYPVLKLPESRFISLCPSRNPQGIMAVIRLPRDAETSVLPDSVGGKILLLEDVQNPGNVGTLIRTAVAFGFSGVMMSPKCADAFSPKCVQSTAGTILSVWIRRTPRYLALAETLKARGHLLVTADLHGGEEPSVLRNRDRLVLALGNEASGPSDALTKLSDHQLRIPLAKEKAESLNVAACGAILLYLSSEGACHL